jgi:hypothetical protein
MNRYRRIIWLVGVFLLAVSGIAFAQEDREGCKDHPMRMAPGTFLIK